VQAPGTTCTSSRCSSSSSSRRGRAQSRRRQAATAEDPQLHSSRCCTLMRRATRQPMPRERRSSSAGAAALTSRRQSSTRARPTRMAWTGAARPATRYSARSGAGARRACWRAAPTCRSTQGFYQLFVVQDQGGAACRIPCSPFMRSVAWSQAPTVQMKACRRCGVEKPATDFYRNKTNPDGLYNNCKGCFQCAFPRAHPSAALDRMLVFHHAERATLLAQHGGRLQSEWRQVCHGESGCCISASSAYGAFAESARARGAWCAGGRHDSQARRARMPPLEERVVAAKECKRCRVVKPATDFYRNKLMADGLYSHCKARAARAARVQARRRCAAPQAAAQPRNQLAALVRALACTAAPGLGSFLGQC
jgi:hypothetical protein